VSRVVGVVYCSVAPPAALHNSPQSGAKLEHIQSSKPTVHRVLKYPFEYFVVKLIF